MEEFKVNKELNYVHMLSGGLDSSYGLLKLARALEKHEGFNGKIQPIFVDYGQKAAATERQQSQTITNFIKAKLREPSLIQQPVEINVKSDLFQWCHNVAFTGIEKEQKTCEIENRNMVLFSILFSYLLACAQNQNIESTTFEITGGFKEKEMGDCSRTFFDALSGAFAIYKPKITMKIDTLPLLSRGQIADKVKNLLCGSQHDLNGFLAEITSCYDPKNGKPCGLCYKCRTIAAEKQNGH